LEESSSKGGEGGARLVGEGGKLKEERKRLGKLVREVVKGEITK
jgi:hypothetical protein